MKLLKIARYSCLLIIGMECGDFFEGKSAKYIAKDKIKHKPINLEI